MEGEIKANQLPVGESEEAATQRHDAAASAPEPHSKPMLTVEQQIAHMKAKGITFDLVSEEEAAAHLRTKCQFFRVYAYRKLFPKHVGGPRDGEYVNLDFGHLKALSNLDRQLRDALLAMTLDIEHFAKVRLLTAAEDHGEDGYAVMRGYRESVSEAQRSYIEAELDRRENDPYVGAVIRKYRDDMPAWVFCEAVPFGAFSSLVKYCAGRWGDAELDDIHYLLKYARSARNATAHGACWVNGITDADSRTRPPRRSSTLSSRPRFREGCASSGCREREWFRFASRCTCTVSSSRRATAAPTVRNGLRPCSIPCARATCPRRTPPSQRSCSSSA